MDYYIENHHQELDINYDFIQNADINIAKEHPEVEEKNQSFNYAENAFHLYCKNEESTTEISKSVNEFKESYEKSKSYLEYFGYAFSSAYIAGIGYASPYTAAFNIILGNFKDSLNNFKIYGDENNGTKFSLFDLLHNTTTSLTFYKVANFTEGTFKLTQNNNNSGNKIFKATSLCIKISVDAMNAAFIQKDAYTEIGKKAGEILSKDANNADNKKNILENDYTKVLAKSIGKGISKSMEYFEFSDLINNKSFGKIIAKIIIKKSNHKSSLTFKEFEELIDQSYIGSLKNMLCIKKLKTHAVGSIAIPYCIAGIDYLSLQCQKIVDGHIKK